MAKQPSGRRILVRLFDQSNQPAYLISRAGRIVYCNAACLNWLSVSEAAVVGRVCFYHSDQSADASATAGMCPPPSAFESQESSGFIWRPRDDGRIDRHRAAFLRLSEADVEDYLLVQVSGQSEPAKADGGRMPLSHQLHDELMKLRARSGQMSIDDCLIGQHPMVQCAREQVALAIQSRRSFVVNGSTPARRRAIAQQILDRRGHVGGSDELISTQRDAERSTWVPFDCGVLDADLLVSGVDAAANRFGSNATLLLIEIDQLDGRSQQRLDRCLTQLDDQQCVVATSENCLMDNQQFHQGLASRVSPLRVCLPRLTDHLSDLPFVVQALVERHNRSAQVHPSNESRMMPSICCFAIPGEFPTLSINSSKLFGLRVNDVVRPSWSRATCLTPFS